MTAGVYRTALQKDLARSYETFKEEDVSGKLNCVYGVLGNNGYSYKIRIEKIKSEISGANASEKKYILDALNLVYAHMNSRANGKFRRKIKNRLDASKEIFKIAKDLDASSNYQRLDERYAEIIMPSEEPEVYKIGKNFYRRAGSTLLRVAGGLVGGVVLAVASAVAGWNFGASHTQRDYVPKLQEKNAAVSALEENLNKRNKEFQDLEGKLTVTTTENLQLQERNLELAKKVFSVSTPVDTNISKEKNSRPSREVVIEIPYTKDNLSQLEIHSNGINLKVIPEKREAPTPRPQESPAESKKSEVSSSPENSKNLPQTQSPEVLSSSPNQARYTPEPDVIDEHFNAYGKYLGRKGAQQWKEGKPVESLLTGAFSWVSLGGEVLRQGYEPVAELTGGTIGIISNPSKQHRQEGWRRGIKKGEDTSRFFYRNWWGGPNWNYDFARAGEFVSFKKLDFETEGDPFVKDDRIPGVALRIGADVAAGLIISNNICKSSHRHKSVGKVSGGTSSSPGGVPK